MATNHKTRAALKRCAKQRGRLRAHMSLDGKPARTLWPPQQGHRRPEYSGTRLFSWSTTRGEKKEE